MADCRIRREGAKPDEGPSKRYFPSTECPSLLACLPCGKPIDSEDWTGTHWHMMYVVFFPNLPGIAASRGEACVGAVTNIMVRLKPFHSTLL